MNRVLEIRLPKLFEKQKEILEHSKRFKVVCVGRRSGKTVLCIDILTNEGLSGKRCAYFAPTYKMLKEVWKQLKSTLQPVIKQISEQDKSMILINGGLIDFWSLDSYNSVRGRKYHVSIIDEAAFSPYLEEAWNEAIRPTLIDYLGSGYFFSTPKGFNYFKELFEAERTNYDWKSWQFATYDFNPNIDLDELESFRKTMPSFVYQQEIEAQFIDKQGALIKREWIDYFNAPPEGMYISIGIDTASEAKTSSDYTAISVVGYKDGMYYVLDVARDKLITPQQIANLCRIYAERYNHKVITIEKTGQTGHLIRQIQIELGSEYYVKWTTPTKDKYTRFLPIVGLYEKGLIKHSQRLIKEFQDELLSFNGNGAGHDDMVDSLEIAIHSIVTGTKEFKVY